MIANAMNKGLSMELLVSSQETLLVGLGISDLVDHKPNSACAALIPSIGKR